MKKRSPKINSTLYELLFGIGVYAIIGVILIIILISDKGRSLRGFLTGAAISAGMVIHMYVELEKALYMDSNGALKHTRITSCLRMAVVAGLAVLLGLAKEDVISVFVGIMALKVSAYIQPLTHKFFNKINRKGR